MAATPGLQVVIDCANPRRLAEFWAAALGYIVQPPPPGFDTWEDFGRAVGMAEADMDSRSAVIDQSGQRPRLYFQRVPEPKVTKNRVHLDIHASAAAGVQGEEAREHVAKEVERLTTLGATVVEGRAEYGEHWVVMQDPEGNEFCVS